MSNIFITMLISKESSKYLRVQRPKHQNMYTTSVYKMSVSML